MVIVNFENNANSISEEKYVKLIEKVVSFILQKEACPYPSEVSVLLTDNAGIREINREFREKDCETDVLSFPNFDFNVPADFNDLKAYEEHFDYFNPENHAFYLGDIMISEERARIQAEEYGHSYTREFSFLIAHSLLHLIGYDHMTDEEAKIMEEKQRSYLDELGITRDFTIETPDQID